jgi:hypothetical protein
MDIATLKVTCTLAGKGRGMRLCKSSKAGCEDRFLVVNSARRATALSGCASRQGPGAGEMCTDTMTSVN